MKIKILVCLTFFIIFESFNHPANDPEFHPLLINNEPARLEICLAGKNSVRITLKPVDYTEQIPSEPLLADNVSQSPVISIHLVKGVIRKKVGNLDISIKGNPLTVVVKNKDGKLIQQLVFNKDNSLKYMLDNDPVLGLGEGGPLPDDPAKWKEQTVQFNRNGFLDLMEPRYQTGIYGQRNPVALLAGTSGWALYVAAPWGVVDMSKKGEGLFTPWSPPDTVTVPQNFSNQKMNLIKGRPPFDKIVPGLYDIFVFDASDPAIFMKELSEISGPAVLPPKWAMGFMQSHRTLIDENQMLEIVDTFRSKKIPVDAVIYLGTGFCPRGWNTRQPSFTFNPEVYLREPEDVISDMHKRNVKVILHMVPWDRDKLPGLTGSIPPKEGEVVNRSHIGDYWNQHQHLIDAGADGFWPDEGDWFDLYERVKRYQLYYQGMLSSKPGQRPWNLLRNGHLGIARWGGWIWSGDPQSSWKTLEAQIASGLNTSLSLSPFWGSDIGGFIPTEELTGELYARWFQFGAFCPSFRAHGRNWWLRLPWGWGQPDMGPVENSLKPPDSEMSNPAIEPICRKYAELRYQLLSYNYTLTWEARNTGMPMMRAMWLHFPEDHVATDMGDQYMWGKSLLIAPVYEKGATERSLYLPEGMWYDWWTSTPVTGGKEITKKVDLSIMPIYVRAGSIIPVDPVRQYTSEKVDDPLTIRVYTGTDGDFLLYEDDGESMDYQAGKYNLIRFNWDEKRKILKISQEGPDDSASQAVKRVFRIEIIPEGEGKIINYNGGNFQLKIS